MRNKFYLSNVGYRVFVLYIYIYWCAGVGDMHLQCAMTCEVLIRSQRGHTSLFLWGASGTSQSYLKPLFVPYTPFFLQTLFHALHWSEIISMVRWLQFFGIPEAHMTGPTMAGVQAWFWLNSSSWSVVLKFCKSSRRCILFYVSFWFAMRLPIRYGGECLATKPGNKPFPNNVVVLPF